MYGYRGRGGARQQTPANVQCQKSRHYSYECKAAPQERPYVARPSRTQQLLNPKLKPKLTNDVLDPVERKKGVADEELAKKEAERAKKRELEKEDDEPPSREPLTKRQRSASVDSVSTISTRSSRSPPPRRRASPSPARVHSQNARRASPGSRSRSYSSDYDSDSDRDQRRSVRGTGGRDSPERSVSPRRGDYDSMPRKASLDEDRGRQDRTRRDKDTRQNTHQRDSRSPERGTARGRDQGMHGNPRDYRRRDDRTREDERPARSPPRREPPRERSPSPFSKRLALTRSMNSGR